MEESDKLFRFSVAEIGPGEANAIRRASMNSTATFAVEKVTMYENSSALFDEYITHRIALIPIKTPAKGYSEDDNILFTLEAEGPKVVYSSELKSTDKEVKVANEKIPIIKLSEGQRLRLEATAVLGKATNHSKFQPGLITYDKVGERYEFYVETFGQMPPRQIINNGLESVRKSLKSLEKEVKGL